MGPQLLAVLIFVSAQAASGARAPARVFGTGVTFAQFLEHARAQREVWLANSSRADIPVEIVNRLKRVRDGLRVLIVAEDWCADSVHTVPYIANLASAAGVETRIIDRTEGAPIMLTHRTRDGRPVTPTVVLLRHGRDVGAWIERPAPLQQLFFAMATDKESARRFAERERWYDVDRGRTTLAEFVALAERTAGR
ncbi:MAG: thioredoxin family protein [Vicinamibacterales bacterium]